MITDYTHSQYMLSAQQMSKEDLLQEVDFLFNYMKDIENRNYAGVLLPKKTIDRIEAIWPDKHKALNSVLEFAYSSFGTIMEEVLTDTEMIAMSGAMRYPFSHEASFYYSKKAVIELT